MRLVKTNSLAPSRCLYLFSIKTYGQKTYIIMTHYDVIRPLYGFPRDVDVDDDVLTLHCLSYDFISKDLRSKLLDLLAISEWIHFYETPCTWYTKVGFHKFLALKYDCCPKLLFILVGLLTRFRNHQSVALAHLWTNACGSGVSSRVKCAAVSACLSGPPTLVRVMSERATHTCPSSCATVKAALSPLSWMMEHEALESHMVPSSARPSVSHRCSWGLRQMFSLRNKTSTRHIRTRQVWSGHSGTRPPLTCYWWAKSPVPGNGSPVSRIWPTS